MWGEQCSPKQGCFAAWTGYGYCCCSGSTVDDRHIQAAMRVGLWLDASSSQHLHPSPLAHRRRTSNFAAGLLTLWLIRSTVTMNGFKWEKLVRTSPTLSSSSDNCQQARWPRRANWRLLAQQAGRRWYLSWWPFRRRQRLATAAPEPTLAVRSRFLLDQSTSRSAQGDSSVQAPSSLMA